MRTSFFAGILITLVFLIAACDVINLDTPPTDDPLDQNVTVSGPNTLPSSQDTFISYLSGSNGKTWNASQFTLQGMDGFQNCRLDDVMTLESDGSYQFDGGNVSCGGEDQREAQGTWNLDFENNRLSFVLGGDTFEGEVVGLTENTLVIRGTYLGMTVEARYDAQ